MEHNAPKKFVRPEGPPFNSHDRKVVEHNATKEWVRPEGPTVDKKPLANIVNASFPRLLAYLVRRAYLPHMSGKYLSLLVHFTWSTAHREPWIEPNLREDLYSIIGGIARKRKAKLLAAGAVDDHIHLYTSLPSTISIADFVNAIKANSSKWIHESFKRLCGFAWQEGYGAFSVSKSDEARVMRYVKEQERHHKKRTFKEEFLTLLKKHQIDYDVRYIWD